MLQEALFVRTWSEPIRDLFQQLVHANRSLHGSAAPSVEFVEKRPSRAEFRWFRRGAALSHHGLDVSGMTLRN